jgi:hypothetical protein
MILAAKLSSDDPRAMSLLLQYDMLYDARHNFSSSSNISNITHNSNSSSSAIDMLSSCGLSPLSAALQCGNVNISAVLLQVRLGACRLNALLYVCCTIYMAMIMLLCKGYRQQLTSDTMYWFGASMHQHVTTHSGWR